MRRPTNEGIRATKKKKKKKKFKNGSFSGF